MAKAKGKQKETERGRGRGRRSGKRITAKKRGETFAKESSSMSLAWLWLWLCGLEQAARQANDHSDREQEEAGSRCTGHGAWQQVIFSAARPLACSVAAYWLQKKKENLNN